MAPTKTRLRPSDITAADGSVTLRAPDELVLPPLDVEVAGRRLTPGDVLRVGITAEHVDTPDLALLRSATALTRRTLTGDVDRLPDALREELGPRSGWLLDAPGDGAVSTTRRVADDDGTLDDARADGAREDEPSDTATEQVGGEAAGAVPADVLRWLRATVRGRDLVTALRTRAEVSLHLLDDAPSATTSPATDGPDGASGPGDAGEEPADPRDDRTSSPASTASPHPAGETPASVVEVVERVITSTVPGRGVTTTTRELRVAPSTSTPRRRRRESAALVTAVVAALVDAGATPLAAADVAARGSRSTAVLRRALDAADPGSVPAPRATTKPLTLTSPAPDVVRAATEAGVDALVTADRAWRGLSSRDGDRSARPDRGATALESFADAVLRARAALAVAGALRQGAPQGATVTDLPPPAQGSPARRADELVWLGGLVDAERRALGTQTLLTDLLRASPVDTVRGRARETLLAATAERVRAADDALTTALDGQRYLDLLDALEASTDENSTEHAPTPRAPAARTGLVRLATTADRRLVDDVEAVDVALDQDSHDLLLERVRQAAASVAALATLLADVASADSRPYARDVGAAATHLARYADSAGARHLLASEALTADADGLSSFTHGRLHAQASAVGEGEEAAYELAWASAARPRRRRWMA